MKKVIKGQELQEKIQEAIHLLCETVKQTLGPKGNNVIIDSSQISPFITNDGVTIARNIESEDEGIKTILEFIKEASVKTNEVVGDGTTTTLVLLESLYQFSLEYVNKGIHPIVLKQNLEESFRCIVGLLSKMKRRPNSKTLRSIATVSSGDDEIGAIVSKSFQLVKNKAAILIQEKDKNVLSMDYYKGYYFSTTLASPYFLRNQSTLIFEDALLLIFQGDLQNLESISFLLNEAIEKNRSFIIVANRFDDYFVSSIVSLELEGKIHCCLLSLMEYGINERIVKQDLEKITGAKIILNENDANSFDVGYISNITIQSEITRIDFSESPEIQKYAMVIQKEGVQKEEFQQDFYEKRLAMFTNGIVKINVGGFTKTECREKRMRVEDAICAICSSKHGVLPGGGVSFLKISKLLTGDTIANDIWRKTLVKPFETILKNAGLEYKMILPQMEKEDFNILYNVAKNQYEDCFKTLVVDPYDVVLYSLNHAVSIALMLLTTTSLVINEQLELERKNFNSEI